MSRTIILIPISAGVGVTSVSLGLVHSLEQKGAKVGFLKPISQPSSGEDIIDRSTAIIRTSQTTEVGEPFMLSAAEALIGQNQTDVLLEKIVERHQQLAKNNEIIVIEGLIPTRTSAYAHKVNYEIAQTLDAEIVLVAAPLADNPAQLKERVDTAVAQFGGRNNPNLLGVVINKFNAPVDESGRTRPDLAEMFDSFKHSANNVAEVEKLFSKDSVKLLACIEWNAELSAPRAVDLAKHLGASIIKEGEIQKRRIRSVTFCARSLPNMVEHIKAGCLLVASADRPDVIVAAALAAMNGVEIGALLLTGGYKIDSQIAKLCEPAFEKGLPIFRVEGTTWQTGLNLHSFSLEVPVDDKERINAIKQFVSEKFDASFIDSVSNGVVRARRLSPAAFRYQLTELAREAKKRIVLPEGDEPRTVKAAVLCAERGIAECVLLAKPSDVERVAEAQGVTLGKGITVIDPESIAENYVERLVELRKAKGMTEMLAREQLKDTVVLGTMMLEANEVDGLVSGAVHTTANTIRPPMQIIKTAPGSSIVSSIFFMLLPDQVLVYGDCAVNPDPTAEQLAEIAIQSAESAKAFGIDPRVAMLSYSTGTSGSGADVEKVKEATRIAKEKRPDLVIDGPLQYDAAIMEDVARSKAPDSPVAGKATVFVFPDLNTGNTTYKAVQRSADLVSIGPMLQGMRKPVNDLSRGALVDDIVYTIALTAIQATQ
ncbi:Phosphate acetyltransferase [Bibersteinia trehalosi USDA-ARS-USMARC-188]|uniref:Phosphate acetyltransferase n=4 Tax=Bibersteinia trehalosi TaxID=47735 RepID=W0RAG9_BIBTR|nr:phosphate acetyltransferase [Bibersteinia trehalosi]AGH38395.1 Phosphate acetyltransferase [Bibersteinia trehalosi USDA-ARS-USMARC-192]AHG81806.1 Phosphate acetyltransferase [Bibersteinia trehalosi USDA-ARS-USMARC-188]AHG84095.1 Phosphate acetyltransferase [Bibersteinia trehalosi USDA-ARS-USMARC-189]AHG86383.1 Phosphate acetyltransferase [Bibersteinia trehalosi USDA-ARS-USMARC-190]OAQ15100.1 phosphate acetyltransferase [Bibersteinia trehalosi Y31]